MPSKAGSSAEGPTLILPDLSFDDEGIYECEAYNSEGSDTYQGRINVQGKKKKILPFKHLFILYQSVLSFYSPTQQQFVSCQLRFWPGSLEACLKTAVPRLHKWKYN